MAEVIDITGRQGNRRQLLKEAMGRLLQCWGCRVRCARCGYAIEEEAHPLAELEAILCPACHADYQTYLRRQRGYSDPDSFWQNQDWAALWSPWLDHQKAMVKYRRSKDCQRLLTELTDK